MSTEEISREILERASRYVAGEGNLCELYTWVWEHFEEWDVLPAEDDARYVASGILNMEWSHADDDFAREAVSQDLAKVRTGALRR